MRKTTRTKTSTSKAYLEGYMEGRFGLFNARNPHPEGKAHTDWAEGFSRGVLLRHFHEETKPQNNEVAKDLLSLRRSLGDRL